MIEINVNPSNYNQYFTCNSSSPTIGEASNITSSNVQILQISTDNPIAIILFGIALYGTIFLFVIVKRGDDPFDVFEEMILEGSLISKILVVIGIIGISVLMSTSVVYGAIFLFYILNYILNHILVSCAGWILIFFDFIIAIIASLLAVLENG
jgi:hypothetical protein